MPLIKGKSDRAFSENVRTEMHEGKPLGQSLAIAYATKRRAKKREGMAHGGEAGVNRPYDTTRSDKGRGSGTSEAGMHARGQKMAEEKGQHVAAPARKGMALRAHRKTLSELESMRGQNRENLAEGGETGVHHTYNKRAGHKGSGEGVSEAGASYRASKERGNRFADLHREDAISAHKKTLSELQGMRGGRENLQRGGYAGRRFAEGGEVDNYQSPSTSRDQEDHRINFHEDETHEYECPPEPGVEHNSSAVMEDDRDLNQHGEDEQGPYSVMMAEGGFIGSHQTDEHELDMVDRIMAQRQEHFSRGGQVANHTPAITGSEENEFDDLVLRDDDMEDADYTGANSGDEKGNAAYDERSDDMVSRIMRSRRLKSKGMPEVMSRQQ